MLNQKHFVIGNLGRDAEIKTDSKGKQFIKFSVACTPRKNAPTEWYTCLQNAYGDNVTKFVTLLRKGSTVVVVGYESVEVYEGKPQRTIYVDDIDIVKVAYAEDKTQPQPRNAQARPQNPLFDDEGFSTDMPAF